MAIGHTEQDKGPASRILGCVPVLWITFCVRAVTLLAQGLWRDEVDQWRFAYQSSSEMLGNLMRAGWNGPLYSPMLRGWIALAGDSVYSMRFLSVLFGVLSVALAHALLHRLLGRRVAELTALLVGGSPYMVWYAQEIKMYSWVPLLVLLALYALDRASATARARWWWVVFVATTLAIYSHVLAALLIPVLVLWFLLHPSRAPRAWIGAALTALGLTLPYLPLLSWQAAIAFVPRETGFPARSLGQMATALLSGWAAGISQGAWETTPLLTVVMATFGGLAVVGLGSLVATGQTRAAARLLVWLGLPLTAVWLVSLWSPLFADRYLIWSAPAFYALAAVGVCWLRRIWPLLGLATLALVLVFDSHGLYVQATEPIKPQFEPAAAYVEARREVGDLLLFQIPYNHHVYEAYAEGGLGDWAEAPFTNWREPDGTYRIGSDDVAREMRRLVAGYDRVWLIYSEVGLWDDRELVRVWLDQTFDLRDQRFLLGVSLFLYSRPIR